MTPSILNLTQHAPTTDQIEAGVFPHPDSRRVQQLLTFDDVPTPFEIRQRAETLASLAYDACQDPENTLVMIGGAPYLMAPLETALRYYGLTPCYAFSKRVSVEKVDPITQVVTKVNEFRHSGFVLA